MHVSISFHSLKSRSKRNKKEKTDDPSNFKIDVKDDRFSSLLQADKFAIDPTSTEYKATPAMQSLLQEQQARLLKEQREQEKRSYDADDAEEPVSKKSKTEVTTLANKIKQKFSKKK